MSCYGCAGVQALKATAPVGISSLMERDKRRDSALSSLSCFFLSPENDMGREEENSTLAGEVPKQWDFLGALGTGGNSKGIAHCSAWW